MNWKSLSLLTAAVLWVSGCEQNGPATSDPGLAKFPLPRGITLRKLPSDVTAQARILLGDQEVAMAPLTISGTTATAHFQNLPPGSYTVLLQFTQTSDSLVLATATKPIDFGDQATELSFSQKDYSYPDDDNDKFSNLDELNEETNPGDGQDYPQPARVFITSVKGPADLSTWTYSNGKTGVAAADAICQARANAAGFTTQFKAWISDSNNDAYCRILGLGGKRDSATCQPGLLGDRKVGPWVRTDGHPVFPFSNPTGEEDWNTMLVPICFDENGVDLCDDEIYAWTGSDQNGRYLKEYGTCLGWTSTSNDDRGGYGSGNATIGNWTASWKTNCGATDAEARLYCFETTQRAQVLPQYQNKNHQLIFVSSITGTGDLNSWPGAGDLPGLEAADAVCQRLARESNLPHADKFKAWLSDGATPVSERISSNGPWSRPDGVLVAEDKDMLLSGNLHTSISVNEKGDYIEQRVWTGTLFNGSKAKENCSDWHHDINTEFGKRGSATSARNEWTDADHWDKVSCNQKAAIYCLEDE